MGMHTHTSAFCQLSSTLHLPNAYGPPPSTLHQFFHLFTIAQLWPTLPMSYACSTVAWGVLCTAVGKEFWWCWAIGWGRDGCVGAVFGGVPCFVPNCFVSCYH